MDQTATEQLLDEQLRYYRARAPEYEDWWFRRGRHDLGPDENERWRAQVAEVETALERFGATGRVLELACGTGLWTRHLARTAERLTAVDASPEVIALNRARVGSDRVEYVQADLFAWRPATSYDACFLGFWVSHVPERRFDGFWRTVASAVAPHGRVFLVDSARQDAGHPPAIDGETTLRQLADGREFRIVKRIWEPAELERRLAALGFEARIRRTGGGALLYGDARLSSDAR